MRIDDRTLSELTVRSQDLQADALRDAKANLADLADLRADRGEMLPDPEQRATYDCNRRTLLQRLGLTGGALAARGAVTSGIGAALVGILGKPALAQTPLDVQILNTASSLENLAVATYTAALSLPFIKNGNKVIVAFAETTRKQHAEHGAAFNAQAKALGGKEQTAPNPQFAPVVEQAKPNLKTPLDVVRLAATLEEVASDTYLTNLTQFGDTKSKEIMGSVMGVEVQHLATLRAVEALLEANAPQFIAIPTNLAQLPAAAGSAAFKDGAFLNPEKTTVAPPASGAVK